MKKTLIVIAKATTSVFLITLGLGFLLTIASLGSNASAGILAIIMMMCGIGFIFGGLVIWDTTGEKLPPPVGK